MKTKPWVLSDFCCKVTIIESCKSESIPPLPCLYFLEKKEEFLLRCFFHRHSFCGLRYLLSDHYLGCSSSSFSLKVILMTHYTFQLPNLLPCFALQHASQPLSPLSRLLFSKWQHPVIPYLIIFFLVDKFAQDRDNTEKKEKVKASCFHVDDKKNS